MDCTAFLTKISTRACLTGIRDCPFLVSLRFAGDRVRVLLRQYISHHQTSEQGGQWSLGSQSKCPYGNHIT